MSGKDSLPKLRVYGIPRPTTIVKNLQDSLGTLFYDFIEFHCKTPTASSWFTIELEDIANNNPKKTNKDVQRKEQFIEYYDEDRNQMLFKCTLAFDRVDYKDSAHINAESVFHECDGFEFDEFKDGKNSNTLKGQGFHCRVEWVTPNPNDGHSYVLKKLPTHLTHFDIRNAFPKFGRADDCFILKMSSNKTHTAAKITFLNPIDRAKIQKHIQENHGRLIQVVLEEEEAPSASASASASAAATTATTVFGGGGQPISSNGPYQTVAAAESWGAKVYCKKFDQDWATSGDENNKKKFFLDYFGRKKYFKDVIGPEELVAVEYNKSRLGGYTAFLFIKTIDAAKKLVDLCNSHSHERIKFSLSQVKIYGGKVKFFTNKDNWKQSEIESHFTDILNCQKAPKMTGDSKPTKIERGAGVFTDFQNISYLFENGTYGDITFDSESDARKVIEGHKKGKTQFGEDLHVSQIKDTNYRVIAKLAAPEIRNVPRQAHSDKNTTNTTEKREVSDFDRVLYHSTDPNFGAAGGIPEWKEELKRNGKDWKRELIVNAIIDYIEKVYFFYPNINKGGEEVAQHVVDELLGNAKILQLLDDADEFDKEISKALNKYGFS